ncbi:hypothetical protein AM501_13880 [Aneurinibacillus migulanus]|uniref:cadherin-like beta sandwich domain-containing protein n=1 Tax=Aneurinibacillus migulanus TaxID=47500 RepID=UPI0006B620DC|nr:cadherin-like beta sandwich domain-containing protein [Aneurinibacillus migulanus]KPD07723.1 hypothetical protein AM501_13880 [Aneurinibacillus migulanus]
MYKHKGFKLISMFLSIWLVGSLLLPSMISTTYASAVIDSPTKTKVIDNPSNVNAAPLYNGISVVGLSGGKTGILYKEQDTKNWYYKIVDLHGTPTFFSQINTPSYMGKRSANFFYMKAFALASGKTLITWEGTSGGTDRKTGNPNQFIILDGNGAVLVGPVDINNVTATYNGDTDVAELSNGNIAFVWQGEAFNYLLRIFNISSNSFTSDPITTIESSQSPHTIIANKNGTFLVAQKSEGTLYHNDGIQKKASFPISVTGNDKKQGEALSNGSFAILYSRDESPNYEVRIISDTGSVTSISGDTSALDGYPVLVGLKNGGFLVADTFTDGSGRWFYKAREYKNDGTLSKDWGVVDSDYVREFGVFWSRYEGGFGMYNDATGNLVHHAISSVSNNADLSNLTLSQGTLAPVFASGTTTYTASVGNEVNSVTVTPTVADSTATVKVNNAAAASGVATVPIPLNVGPNTITVMVTAQDGTTQKSYTITITRSAPSLSSNADLSNLTLSQGTLAPIFSSGTTAYTANVDNEVASVTVTPTVADSTATVKVNDVAVTSGVATGSIPLNVGPNTITVMVTAQDGTTQKSYTITVTRSEPPLSNNADLSNLTLSQGTLTPAFAPNTISYTANVGNEINSVTVTPTVADSTATVVVNGVPVTSGSASIPLNVGLNTITVVVTAQNGITKTYSIVVTRGALTNANASSIASSVGDLTPAFIPAHTDYTVNVPHHTTEDTITVIPEDPRAMVNIEEANPLQVGENIFKVTITAPDGVTKKTYTITVMRAGSNNADLQTLQVSPGTLKPIFSPGINAYTVHVARSVSAVTLTANPADREARVSMNGKVTTEDTITIDTDTMVIPIVVTAQDGGKKTYTVTVEREKSGNVHLRNLTVNHGTLTPAFSSETAQYQLNVDHSISSISLTAEGADPDARIAINGKVTTSDSISLNVGTTSINIVVTAPNGEAKTYILNVTRATAPSSGGGGGGSRGSGRDRSDTTTQPVKEPEAPKPPIEETQKLIIVPSDVTGHWAQERISEAIRRGIVTGYPDGTFRPNEPVTRLQWISFLVRALHLQGEGARLNFTDKGEIPAWGQSDVAVAVKNGLISGYPDGSFRPNQEITRAEMVSILARILKLKPDKGLQPSFSDSKAIPAWAQGDVAAVANEGLIQGRRNNVFAPNASTTRAEAIVLLLTMLDKK